MTIVRLATWVAVIFLARLCGALETTVYCSGTDYSDGEWVRVDENSPSDNFDECIDLAGMARSNYSLKVAAKKEDINSKYCNNTIDRPPLVEDNGFKCKLAFYFGGSTSISESNTTFYPKSVKYKWNPRRCKLKDWDPEDFCNLLRDRTVLFVGDSTVFQTAMTLKAMLYFHYASFNLSMSCHRHIYYAGSDRLVNRPKTNFGRGGGVTLFEAAYKLDFNIHFLILSTGYHMHPRETDVTANVTDEAYADSFFPVLNAEIRHLVYQFKKRNIPTKIIYKTENVGHNGCGQFAGPDNTLNHEDELVKLNAFNKYKWNYELETETRFMRFAHSHDMDIIRMYPLYSRPDGHVIANAPGFAVDCLHYCAPGPLNIFSRLFYHYLFVGDQWRQGERSNYTDPPYPFYWNPRRE